MSSANEASDWSGLLNPELQVPHLERVIIVFPLNNTLDKFGFITWPLTGTQVG